MPTSLDTVKAIPDVLKALQDNPMACLVVVCLAAFALVAFAIQQRK